MEVIYGTQKRNILSRDTAVGLGNFDGLHIGHMTLVNALMEEAKKRSLESIMYTFSNHPNDIVNKMSSKGFLMSSEKKIQILDQAGLDAIYFDEFDKAFSETKADDFIQNVLIGRLHAKLVVIGFNYKFGHKGLGNAELLKKAAKFYGFDVLVIPPVLMGEEVVSSTYIKGCIVRGEVEKAAKFLGRDYSIFGEVAPGQGIGAKIGVPTANITPTGSLIIPKRGVYATSVCVDGKSFKSITNIGINPTFGLATEVVIETHIVDFDQNLYGKTLEIQFKSRIRDEKKFDSIEELVKQIQIDMQSLK